MSLFTHFLSRRKKPPTWSNNPSATSWLNIAASPSSSLCFFGPFETDIGRADWMIQSWNHQLKGALVIVRPKNPGPCRLFDVTAQSLSMEKDSKHCYKVNRGMTTLLELEWAQRANGNNIEFVVVVIVELTCSIFGNMSKCFSSGCLPEWHSITLVDYGMAPETIDICSLWCRYQQPEQSLSA